MKRLKDRKLLDLVKELPCVACGDVPADPAHVRSRGAGGPDEEWNVMPLCRIHHVEQHKVGWRTLAAKYPDVASWLENHGWYFDDSRLRRAA